MNKKINWRKGSGEFIAFAILGPIICILVIIMTAYIQLSFCVREMTNALSVAGRSVAICTNLEDAQKQAQLVTETAIKNDNISNIVVAVDYANGDTEWMNGGLILLEVEADIKTLTPLTSGKRKSTTIISIENSRFSDSEFRHLAAILATEGRPTEYESMLAVGTVIMNRLETQHGGYTKLIDIIHAPSQFEGIKNPNYDVYVATEAPPEAQRCAKALMRGERHQFLMNPKCVYFKTDLPTYRAANPIGVSIGGNWFHWPAGTNVDFADYNKNSDNKNKLSKDAKEAIEKTSDLRRRIVELAISKVGNPYVYGGTNLDTGADCSGFIQTLYAKHGVSISRTAASQCNDCEKIEMSELKPGDLLFYRGDDGSIGHVTMYIGGSQVVHASSSTTGIIISSINYRKIDSCGRLPALVNKEKEENKDFEDDK